MPSWNAALSEQSGNNLRSTESDTGLSTRNTISPRFSPGKSNVFKISPDQHLSGGSPDSDASSETITKRMSLPTTTQETYFINEVKFVNQEILRVRDHLTNKVSRCLSNCWRDLLWHALLTDGNVEEDKKTRKKSIVDEAAMQLNVLVCEWEEKNVMENMANVPMVSIFNVYS